MYVCMAEVTKALEGKVELRGGKSQVPRPLYETLPAPFSTAIHNNVR